MDRNRHDKKVLVGMLILLAGILLLLSGFGAVGHMLRRYVFRWEAILIIIGLISFVNNRNKGFGLVMLAIGGIFYARNLLNLPFSFWELLLPLLLIIAGLGILFHRRSPKSCLSGPTPVDGDYLDEMNIFSGTEKMVNSQSFKGGKLTCIFGGQKIVFSRARIEQKVCTIEVFALFGGFEMVIPDNWKLSIGISPIFGGISDKRISSLSPGEEPAGEMIITGTVIFGGGELKSY